MPNRVWDLFVELRKELLESQKIRAQIIGFKITFISAAIGLIAANNDALDDVNLLLFLPAFAAIFFDFIINSYSYSIKRIGCYIRLHIEPELKSQDEFPKDFRNWEDFLHGKDIKTKQFLSLFGNSGLTFLAVVVGVISIFIPFQPFISCFLFFVLVIFFIVDIYTFMAPFKFDKYETQYGKE